jgi:alpha/beta superfamily hydrolase
METPIILKAPGADLEGRFRAISKTKAVVVTHPHPLYGGDMDNAVVLAIADAFEQAGYSVLRFNFRGTGRSQGSYDDGFGEQQDVTAAIGYLKHSDFQGIDLVGYSFGAWVLARWAVHNAGHAHRIILIAPPIAFMDFDKHSPIPGLTHIFTGSIDDLAPPDPIRFALRQWQPDAPCHVIQGADHSFWGHFQTLQQGIVQVLQGGRERD